MNQKKTNIPSLYVVGTPIGNIGDITTRAIEIIKNADSVIVENTHTFTKLANKLQIDISDKNLFRFGDFNNKESLDQAIDFILNSKNCVLTTEAGTPLISDPGFKIVEKIRANNLNVNIASVPGPSALTAHLSISGLPTDKFMFLGFLPKTKSKRKKILSSLKTITDTQKTTFIMYESKYKLVATLEDIKTLYPLAKVSIGKELTKMHEHVYYGDVLDMYNIIRKTTPKGEYVIHLLIA